MQLRWERGREPSYNLKAFSLVGLILFGAARFIPIKEWFPYPLCYFRALTGWPCPTCGMTTSFIHLTHFEPLEALRASPLGVAVFFILAAMMISLAGRVWLKWPAPRVVFTRQEKIAGVALLILGLMLNWAYNILHAVTHKI